jgi:hypothetical protein
MDYVRINNFMQNGQRRIKRNEIIDNYDLNNIFREDLNNIFREDLNNIFRETKENQIYNSKIDDINTEMIEFNEARTCRYCFEGETYNNELISPCLCKGSSKYIHLKCLQSWRLVNKDNPEKRDYCEICKYHYAIKRVENILKYRIASDVTVWFLYFFLLIAMSFFYGLIDYYGDFFTLKILTPFSYNNTAVYNRFTKMKKYSDSYFVDTTFDYCVYSFFIFDMMSFYINSIYIIYNRKKFTIVKKHPLYKKNLHKFKKIAIFMHFSIFYCYYSTLFFDEYYILSNTMPVTMLLNFFTIILFINDHNKIIKKININNVEHEIVYSFEENPLLSNNDRP